MKKFARFLLVWIIVSVLCGVSGYLWLNNAIAQVYDSTTEIYVVPGETSEASLRASDGGLKDDFAVVIKSDFLLSAAQKTAGTKEDLASYITVKTPSNSNIIEIICSNPAQSTAKQYVDAVGKNIQKLNTVIPIEKISVLSEGTSTGIPYKPNLYKYTAFITLLSSVICFFIELIIVLMIIAFGHGKVEDEELEYNRYYGDVIKYREKYPSSYLTKQSIQAEKEAAAALANEKKSTTTNSETSSITNVNNQDDDDELLYTEIEPIKDDIFPDHLDDSKTKKNKASSSDVIGRIPH